MKKLLTVIAGLFILVLLLIGVFVFINWAPDRPVSELKSRWALPPSVFIEVNGMNVHLRDEGPRNDSNPIVLLHGTSASLHTWEGWTQALKNKRRVIRFDQPGFGLTGPTPDNIYTMDMYVNFVIAVLDTLGVEKFALAGNSFGGNVAWNTAVRHPERVTKLILIDSSGYTFKSASVPIGFRIARMPVLNRLAANILPRSMIESSLKNVYGDPQKVTPDLIDLYFDITTREGNRHALVERFKQSSEGVLTDRIPEIKIPTLIIWGGQDRLIPPSVGERFHNEIAGSKLVVFKKLGHVPHEEHPEQTAAAVEQFLGI